MLLHETVCVNCVGVSVCVSCILIGCIELPLS